MGGTSGSIESDSFVEAIERLRARLTDMEGVGLWLDSISIFVKNDKGEYTGIGNDGIEVAVFNQYKEKPTKKVVIMFHAHS